MPFFVILFIVIPVLEIITFIQVGQFIGTFWTLTFALVTAVLGGAIVKQQGAQTLTRIRNALGNQALPLGALFDGICLAIAGALLITPGFVTDAIGSALLVPSVRRMIAVFIKKNNIIIEQHTSDTSNTDAATHVIDAEFEEITPSQQTDKKD